MGSRRKKRRSSGEGTRLTRRRKRGGKRRREGGGGGRLSVEGGEGRGSRKERGVWVCVDGRGEDGGAQGEGWGGGRGM